MIIKSQKSKLEFNNKYWMAGYMLSSLSEYGLTHDFEVFVEPCEFIESLYVYVDDISEEKLLEIFNNNEHFNHRDFIPTVNQAVFDEADFSFESESPFSEMAKKYKSPSLVKIIDWK